MPDDFASPDPSVSWRKLLHHMREYRQLLARSDAWDIGRENEINTHAKALGLAPAFERYETRDADRKLCLRVTGPWKSKIHAFPIFTVAGDPVPCLPTTKAYMLALLADWESKATAELEAVPAPVPQAVQPSTPGLELRKVTAAVRELNAKCKGVSNPSAEGLAGANLREAVKVGAFAGAEYAELRHLIAQREIRPDGMTIHRAVAWLLGKGKLPAWVGNRSDMWLPGALLPIADLIDAEAGNIGHCESPAHAGTDAKPDPIAVAVAMKSKDQNLSIRKVAKAVGIPHSTLAKHPLWKAAVDRLKQIGKGKLKMGNKSKDGAIEAADG